MLNMSKMLNYSVYSRLGYIDKYVAADLTNVSLFLYLQHSSLVNITNKDGNTPLHHACNVDSLDTAKVLIDSGAEISVMNRNNETPADLTNVC